jgi:hypothetical protein
VHHYELVWLEPPGRFELRYPPLVLFELASQVGQLCHPLLSPLEEVEISVQHLLFGLGPCLCCSGCHGAYSHPRGAAVLLSSLKMIKCQKKMEVVSVWKEDSVVTNRLSSVVQRRANNTSDAKSKHLVPLNDSPSVLLH